MTTEASKVPSYLVGMGCAVDMEGEKRYNSGMFRFWLKPGEKANIVFLSDGNDVPCIWEHQVMLYKKGKKDYNNYFTCLQSTFGSCPLCDYSTEFETCWRQKVQLFTILNLNGYFSKKLNKQMPYSRQILTAKKATSEILMRKYAARLDQNQRLRGAQFAAFRGSDSKSPNVGTEFEFIKMVDLGQFPPDDVKVLDVNALAPNRDLMIRTCQILRGAANNTYSGAMAGHAGESTDDVVSVEYGDEHDGQLPQGNSAVE